VSESLSQWLGLREAADRAARSVSIARAIADALPRGGPVRVLDLGSGTGANLRYLAAFLSLPQEWLLVDLDQRLLDEASASASSLEGVRVETQAMNLGPLDRPELFAGRHVVTASALLDLVSESWLRTLAARCRSAGASAVFSLTYDGRSACWPPDAEDDAIRELLNAHQRSNDKGFGRAAGPDAPDAAQRAFESENYRVVRARSDWEIAADVDTREFQRQLFAGWAEASREAAPMRQSLIDGWLRRRNAHLEAGRSAVMVGHEDIMCLRADAPAQ
jgi:SAM-dependent methyltransferase